MMARSTMFLQKIDTILSKEMPKWKEYMRTTA